MSTPAAPDPALVRACESIERAAFADHFANAPAGLAAEIGLSRLDAAGAMAIGSHATARRMYNHVFALGLDADAADSLLEQLDAFYRRAGAHAYAVAPPPSAHHDALVARLPARGFRRAERWLRLVRTGGEAPRVDAPAGLTVRGLAAPDAAALGTLVTSAFPHAPGAEEWIGNIVTRERWRVFGCFDRGSLVACGALFARGATGWLGLGVTASTHRGRGAQRALIAARVAAAASAGLTVLAAETTDDTPDAPNPSTHNLWRMGFRELYPRQTWTKVLREVAPVTL